MSDKLDEGLFVIDIIGGETITCCGKKCLRKIIEEHLRRNSQLIYFYFTFKTTDLTNKPFRSFIMSYALVHTNEDGEFRVPSIPHALCWTFWLNIMTISNSTYKTLRQCSLRNRNVLPAGHGHMASTSKNARPHIIERIIRFSQDVANGDGQQLPVRMRRSYGSYNVSTIGTDTIIALPPQYSKWSLFFSILLRRQITIHSVIGKRLSTSHKSLCLMCVYRDVPMEFMTNDLYFLKHYVLCLRKSLWKKQMICQSILMRKSLLELSKEFQLVLHYEVAICVSNQRLFSLTVFDICAFRFSPMKRWANGFPKEWVRC